MRSKKSGRSVWLTSIKRSKSSLRIADVVIFFAIIALPWQARWIYAQHVIRGVSYEYGVFSVYINISLLVIALIVLWMRRGKVFRFSLPVIGFIIWLSVTATLAPSMLLAWQNVILLCCALGYGYIAKLWNKFLVIHAIIVMGLIQTLFAWWQFAHQYILPNTYLGLAVHYPDMLGQPVVMIYGNRILRAFGLLPHPNILGMTLLIAFACALYAYAFSSSAPRAQARSRPLYLAEVMLIFSGILITFSRPAIVGACVLFTIWIFVGWAKSSISVAVNMAKVAVACLALFAVCNIVAQGVWLQRVGALPSNQGMLDQRSTDDRLMGYRQALTLFSIRSMTIGTGMGNYVSQLARSYPGYPVYAYQPVHNMFVLMLIEIGVIGVFLFIIMLYSFWGTRFRQKKISMDEWYWYTVAVVIFASSLVDHYFWSLYVGQALWWLAFGLIVNKEKKDPLG